MSVTTPPAAAVAAAGGPAPVRMREVFTAWWPLAASWLLMGLELPLVSAGMARLVDPKISLAAYGGVVFPLALLIESPIIMLLAASTALVRDDASYRLVRRFTVLTGLTFTALHALVAFTPLYDFVAGGLLGVPADVLEPARLGLRIMTPWTISIAYRRCQQGVMIRHGGSWAVGVGTAVRLLANATVIGVGLALGRAPGIVVGTLAVACGVVGEAIFAGLAVRPVLRDVVRRAPAQAVPLTFPAFLHFYLPLALTPLIGFLAMPLSAAAMSRMPLALDSLAAWPALGGLVFAFRSVGFAYNEVVVALLDRPRAARALRGFAIALGAITSLALLVLAATPLGALWFERVAALPPSVRPLAVTGAWLGVLLPGLSAIQSWYQGVIVHSRATRGITESVAVNLVVMIAVLGGGIAWPRWPGLYVAFAALGLGLAAQVAWLRLRARPALSLLATPR